MLHKQAYGQGLKDQQPRRHRPRKMSLKQSSKQSPRRTPSPSSSPSSKSPSPSPLTLTDHPPPQVDPRDVDQDVDLQVVKAQVLLLQCRSNTAINKFDLAEEQIKAALKLLEKVQLGRDLVVCEMNEALACVYMGRRKVRTRANLSPQRMLTSI